MQCWNTSTTVHGEPLFELRLPFYTLRPQNKAKPNEWLIFEERGCSAIPKVSPSRLAENRLKQLKKGSVFRVLWILDMSFHGYLPLIFLCCVMDSLRVLNFVFCPLLWWLLQFSHGGLQVVQGVQGWFFR